MWIILRLYYHEVEMTQYYKQIKIITFFLFSNFYFLRALQITYFYFIVLLQVKLRRFRLQPELSSHLRMESSGHLLRTHSHFFPESRQGEYGQCRLKRGLHIPPRVGSAKHYGQTGWIKKKVHHLLCSYPLLVENRTIKQ